jgi:hypothetical protein
MKKLLLKILILGLIIYIIFNIDLREDASQDKLLMNHVNLTGTITSYIKSNNHSFGIVKFKVIKSNEEEIDFSKSEFLFPYRIKKKYAEFYGYVPMEAKIGQTINLNSDERSVKFYENKIKLAEVTLTISTDKQNMKYVKENTEFK